MSDDVVLFVFHGLLGGILWLFIHWEWTKKAIAQHTVVSAIAGYLYCLLHSEYNFPNSVMTIVSGYFSTDFIKSVFEFLWKKRSERQ